MTLATQFADRETLIDRLKVAFRERDRIREEINFILMSLRHDVAEGHVSDHAGVLDGETIIEIVGAYFSKERGWEVDKSRHEHLVWPRQVAMFLFREFTEMSLKAIGERFGNKDHSTVISNVNRVKAMIATDPDRRVQVQGLSARLKAIVENKAAAANGSAGKEAVA